MRNHGLTCLAYDPKVYLAKTFQIKYLINPKVQTNGQTTLQVPYQFGITKYFIA